MAALAHARAHSPPELNRSYLAHGQRIYELAATLVEDAHSDEDVQRALEALRLHEAASGSLMLRWLHIVAGDYLRAALLPHQTLEDPFIL